MPFLRRVATSLAASTHGHYYHHHHHPHHPPPVPLSFFPHQQLCFPALGNPRSGNAGDGRFAQCFHTTSRLRDEQIDNAQNHYEALKLEPGATPADIKKSFYSLSKRHHPDHNAGDRTGASRRFVRISEAYAILSVPAKRQAYDRDTLRLSQHNHPHHHTHRRAPGSSYHSTNPAGGRPATGLSRRRGAFQGPPPSFFRSGGWGAHGAKRRAAHEDSTGTGGSTTNAHAHTHHHHHREEAGAGAGTMGGMGPGQDPLKHAGREVPHFDRAGHERTTGRLHADARRGSQNQHHYHPSSTATAPSADPGIGSMFVVVGGVLLLSIVGPFIIGRVVFGRSGEEKRNAAGGGGGGGGGAREKRRKPVTASSTSGAAVPEGRNPG